jgi:hypothetical protein
MAIADSVKLDIYNRALQILGSRTLSSLSEAREPRRELDQAWGPANNLVLRALEEADWNFATKSVKGLASTSIEPSFGYRFAYDKPDDLVRLTELSSSATFGHSMVHKVDYLDEADYWYTNVAVIYVRYVSDDDAYGFDSGKWTEAFKEYLAASLAQKTCVKITNSEDAMRRIMFLKDDSKKHARGRDTMDEGHKRLPKGSWVQSRGQRSGERG